MPVVTNNYGLTPQTLLTIKHDYYDKHYIQLNRLLHALG